MLHPGPDDLRGGDKRPGGGLGRRGEDRAERKPAAAALLRLRERPLEPCGNPAGGRADHPAVVRVQPEAG
jgi:hypothetical protein